jgi:hypothetical protein
MAGARFTEDDLGTFDGYLGYQGIDPASLTPEQLDEWRAFYEDARAHRKATPPVGLMKIRAVPGEHRYGVVVEDGQDLWLALWVRRSLKGEYFVVIPRAEKGWDPHTSYHLDGTLHSKSYGWKHPPEKRQPLTGPFRDTVNLGVFYGHGPKTVGATCDPAAFSGLVQVAPGVLGPRGAGVSIDLVEPGHEPIEQPWRVEERKTFVDSVPWIVITIGAMAIAR